jgi:hypothetical protein
LNCFANRRDHTRLAYRRTGVEQLRNSCEQLGGAIRVGSAIGYLEFFAPANDGEEILWLSASLVANFCER